LAPNLLLAEAGIGPILSGFFVPMLMPGVD
jgi:hypothetical protein